MCFYNIFLPIFDKSKKPFKIAIAIAKLFFFDKKIRGSNNFSSCNYNRGYNILLFYYLIKVVSVQKFELLLPNHLQLVK
jgi:hypothetical protein